VSGTADPHDPDHRRPGDVTPEEIVEEIMAGFRRAHDGVAARFTPAQAGIVRSLVSQVAELIGGPDAGAPGPQEAHGAPPADPAAPGPAMADDPFAGGLAAVLGQPAPSEPPDDPVLARLFPDAYSSDPEAAGEFRRYTEPGLRSGKVAAARTVLATLPDRGGRVRLNEADAETWLRVLTDVRLALGVRLGITEDYEAQLADVTEADPRAAYLHVYDWLTFLQETLVRALW
jgi:uncharacterized protein DUF2017